jgi:hypothetical protein
MPSTPDRPSRRTFVSEVGRLASAAALGGALAPDRAGALVPTGAPPHPGRADWDLSWIDRLAPATDRAVFDWPSLAEPGNEIVLQIAARYLDNCDAAYGAGRHDARIVMNIRTVAVPAALTDDAWQRYALGTSYNVKDPATGKPAVRNPFWHGGTGATTPMLEDLVQRGALLLVCDFALGHLATRLAKDTGGDAETIHRDLRGAFVANAFAVPSGIFGLARAQNAGCAFVRM